MKRFQMLDYIRGFLLKIKDLDFTEASAAHEVVEFLNKEREKSLSRAMKKGKFEHPGEMAAALSNGVYSKEDWDIANGVVVTSDYDEDLDPVRSDYSPSDDAIDRRIKEIEEGKKL